MSSKKTKTRGRTNRTLLAAVLLTLVIVQVESQAGNKAIFQEVVEAKKLKLTSQKAIILRSRVPIKRVSIAGEAVEHMLCYLSECS